MSQLDMTAFDSGLKVLFPASRIAKTAYEEQPMWSWLPKNEKFYGRNMEVPIQHALPGGSSHTFSDAQSGKAPGTYTHFTITRKKDYKLLSLDGETMEASENSMGGYIAGKDREIYGGFAGALQVLGRDLQGNGGGNTAIVASVATNTITFTDPSMVVGFEIGQRYVAASTDGTSGAVASGSGPGYSTVTEINYDSSPTVTFDDVSYANMDATTNKYLFLKGNFGNAVSGFEGWIPATAPTSGDSWQGVDRSVNTRLSGQRFDASTYGLLEGIERGIAQFSLNGARSIDTLWVNDRRFADISLELGSRVQREAVKFGQFAYDTVVMNANNKKLRVMCDHNIKDDVAWALTRKTWEFCSLKKAPRFLHRTGSNMITEVTNDGVELRIGWYGDNVCWDVHKNGRLTLPT